MTYLLPTTVESALAALRDTDSTVVAGATDYYPALQDRTDSGPILDISQVDELRDISLVEDVWRIGAMTTWTDLAQADLPGAFAGLQSAATQIGGVQIQNAASLAGNLCNASPAADGVPPLLTLNAQVELRSATRTRVLDLDEFILGNRSTALEPGELLTAILVPSPEPGQAGSFEKLGSRAYLVISIVMVAAVAQLDEQGIIASARIAVGACSPVARRLPELEHDLVGASIHDRMADLITPEHLNPLSPIDDVRATAAHRMAVTPVLIARALKACQGPL